MNRATVRWAVLSLEFLLAGCAATPSPLVSRDLPEAVRGVGKVGVVVAEARVIDLSAGGSLEVNVEKSEQCPSRLEAAAVSCLRERGFDAMPLVYDDELRALVTEYFPVRDQLRRTRARKEPLGTVPPLASAQKAALARGVDAIAITSIRFICPTLSGAILRAFIGQQLQGEYQADLALFDASGRPVYFNNLSRANVGGSLFIPEYAYSGFVRTLVSDLPRGRP